MAAHSQRSNQPRRREWLELARARSRWQRASWERVRDKNSRLILLHPGTFWGFLGNVKSNSPNYLRLLGDVQKVVVP